MVTAPRVGVTAWSRTFETHLGPTPMYTLQRQYVDSLRASGAVPMLLLPVEEEAVDVALKVLDGVVLSGGNDVEPSLYGASRHARSQPADAERDRFESTVARRAIEAGMPILAICRGIQILNVALGGTLHQNVEEHVEGAGNHDRIDAASGLVHEVELDEGSRLARIFASRSIEVNSMHHQGVAELARGLEAVGRHPESRLVEAVELSGHPWCVAVQWHPEALTPEHPPQLALFRAFSEACLRYRRETG